MTRTERHEYAMLKIQMRALEKGAIISRPTIEGTRYDLVVDWNGRLFRVQVKWAGVSRTEGALSVNLQSYAGGKVTSRAYTASEVDVVLVYSPKRDVILWLDRECFDGKGTLNFRLEPPRNNQTRGCRLLTDYLW